MTARTPHPPTAGDGEAAAAPDTRRPDGEAVSPAVGPIPAIYVPQSPGEASSTGLLRHVALRAARLAASWATRHQPQHSPACTSPGCSRRSATARPPQPAAKLESPSPGPRPYSRKELS